MSVLNSARRAGRRRPQVHGCVLEAVEGRVLLSAAGPQLVADINAAAGGSRPTQFVEFGGALYFVADDGLHGNELWRTDGTEAGTRIVRDVNPGAAAGASISVRPVVFGGAIYYVGITPQNGFELWCTDGTAGGTALVADVYAGSTSSGPSNLTVVGNTLFFSAQSAGLGTELWKSDGTGAGTTLVKDIRPGTASSGPTSLTALGNQLLFVANDGVNGAELWRSDGTADGTQMVAEFLAGSSDGGVGNITEFGGAAYFTARYGAGSFAVYRSDGTAGGTWQISAPGVSSGTLARSDDALYFAKLGAELWTSDGTAAGTTLVKSFAANGDNSLGPTQFVSLGHRVVFRAADPTYGFEPWVTDGTAAGTTRLADILPGSGGGLLDRSPAFLTSGGLGYFVASASAGGAAELWVTDGTAAGTRKLADLELTPLSGSAANVGTLGGQAYFAASAEAGARGELWRSDGTPAGTSLVKDIRSATADSSPEAPATLPNGRTVFRATDPLHGAEIWVTDGTPAGTTLLADIWAGGAQGAWSTPQVAGQYAFFFGQDPAHGTELWRTDGTAAGTQMVVDLVPGPTSGVPFGAWAMTTGKAYFFLASVNGQTGVWRSDGTAAGTTLAVPGMTTMPYPAGDRLVFSRTTPGEGSELWVSNGTGDAPVLLADINPGAASSTPGLLAFPDPLYYFAADDGVHGRELWRTDGTAAGTWLVKDINPSGSSVNFSVAGTAAFVDGMFYFVADDGVHGAELWRTDGTPGGAWLVADIVPGAGSPGITRMAGARGKVFFFADDAVHGNELWASDGTAAGTGLVADLVPGGGSPVVTAYRGAGGAYYFTADDGVHGPELWRSDGTASGTVLYDMIPGPDGAAPQIYQVDKAGRLYLSGFDPQAGIELLVLADDVSPAAVAASLDLRGTETAVTVRFSEDVGASLSASDFVVTDRVSGAALAVASVAFDAATRTATIRFAAPLSDGDYRLTIAAGSVTDAAGNAMAGGFGFDFFVLAGDVNRDRAVNFDDLLVLAKNYNKAGATWADGDLTGDGLVNFDDLLVLAKAYNKSLPAPSPLPAVAPTVAPVTAAATVLTDRDTAKPVFSTARVTPAAAAAAAKPAAVKPKGVAKPKRR